MQKKKKTFFEHGNFAFPLVKSKNGYATFFFSIIPVASLFDSLATATHAYLDLTSKTGNVCPVFSQSLLSFDQQCSSDGARAISMHQTPWKKKIVLREPKPGFTPQESLERTWRTCDQVYSYLLPFAWI